MLDADILILETLGLIFGLEQNPVEPLADIDLARLNTRTGYRRHPVELALQCPGELLRAGIDLLQQARHQAAFLLQQRQQQVFIVDFQVPATHADRLRGLKRFLALLGQLVKVHIGPF